MRARENENETRLEIPKFCEKQFYEKDGIFCDIKKIVGKDIFDKCRVMLWVE